VVLCRLRSGDVVTELSDVTLLEIVTKIERERAFTRENVTRPRRTTLRRSGVCLSWWQRRESGWRCLHTGLHHHLPEGGRWRRCAGLNMYMHNMYVVCGRMSRRLSDAIADYGRRVL
jgi:hypothetical protein